MVKVLPKIQQEVINTYGAGIQTTICMEECSELIQAVSKMKRGKDNKDNLVEEMADVLIVLSQLKIIYDVTDEELQGWIIKKQDRQVRRMEERKA